MSSLKKNAIITGANRGIGLYVSGGAAGMYVKNVQAAHQDNLLTV